MLTNRIIAVFTFRKGVYAEVEKDTSFTTTAWILVVAAAFLNQLGFFASSDLIRWLVGTIGGTILAILGFVVGALVVNWVGRIVFMAEVSFDELVRTLGLAYVWQGIGVLSVLNAFSETPSGELELVMPFALAMMVVAWFVAAREALDLGWIQTGVTVFLGWLAQLVITIVVAALVLDLFESGAAAMGGLAV
jgi:hypothetical protein